MSDLAFPAERFLDAGATPDELAQLVGEFERSDLVVQSSLIEQWASDSTAAIGEYLGLLREGGYFSGPVDGAGESMAAPSDPEPESGAEAVLDPSEGTGADKTEGAPAKK